MAKKTGFEYVRFSNFQELVTLTFTYMPNFTEIEGTFCKRTDGNLRPAILGRLKRVDLKMYFHKQFNDNIILECQTVSLQSLLEGSMHAE